VEKQGTRKLIRRAVARKLSNDELKRLLGYWTAVGGNAALLREIARAKQMSLKSKKGPGAKKKDDRGRLMVAAVICGEAVLRGKHPKTALRLWLARLDKKLRYHPDVFRRSYGPSPQAAADRLWGRLQEDVFTDEDWVLIQGAAEFRKRYLSQK
jgi:hypothetical protein